MNKTNLLLLTLLLFTIPTFSYNPLKDFQLISPVEAKNKYLSYRKYNSSKYRKAYKEVKDWSKEERVAARDIYKHWKNNQDELENQPAEVIKKYRKYKRYDKDRIKNVLEPVGLYDQVIKIDSKALNIVAKENDLEDIVNEVGDVSFSSPIIKVTPSII